MAPLVGSSRVAGPYHRSGIAPCPEGSAANLPPDTREIDDGRIRAPHTHAWVAGRASVGSCLHLERCAFQRAIVSPRGTSHVPIGDSTAAWNAVRSNAAWTVPSDQPWPSPRACIDDASAG